jgi:peptidoglycan/LPS O-acetylase OafA/YrhL
MNASAESSRIHYLDNLRALAMLLGVYLHGALAYAEPSRSIWIATNPQGNVALDASIWWIHLFRMDLFFLLSGYFSRLVIDRKGIHAFLSGRAIRIALPFVLFWPLLTVAMTIVFVFAISYVKHPEGLLRVIVAASRNPEATNASTTYTTMHLWFLYYLLMFSLIAAIVSRCTWLNFNWLFRRGCLLALLPLALVPGVIGGGLPVAAPESFVPNWWPFAWYGLFYWFGWQLFGREALLDQLQPWCWPLVIVGVLLFIPHYLLLPVLDIELIQQASEPRSLLSILPESVLAAYLAVILTLAALLVGQRFLARPNAWLKFCADSSYWVYLIHLPIILFLQTLLIPVAMPVMVKLVLVILVAWFFCLATYVMLVRYTPIGWMLNGKRSFP